MNDFAYVGSELDLFAAVRNWKSYWSQQIRPFIVGDVLEVGAGKGSNTAFLDTGEARRWVCLEPDRDLVNQLQETLKKNGRRRDYEVICGTLGTLDSSRKYDTIIYIDVVEHIEDDRQELILAASMLRPQGFLIVLSPAHQWLYTPFDKSVGHHRRYSRSMMQAISPPGLHAVRLNYLDSVGLAASSANLLLLRQSMPTPAQLSFWDRFMIPLSRALDKALFYKIGKSILAVWQKSGDKELQEGKR